MGHLGKTHEPQDLSGLTEEPFVGWYGVYYLLGLRSRLSLFTNFLTLCNINSPFDGKPKKGTFEIFITDLTSLLECLFVHVETSTVKLVSYDFSRTSVIGLCNKEE